MAKIIVQNTEITVLSQDEKDYISLTDMANGKHDESRALTPLLKWSNLTTLKCKLDYQVFILSANEWLEETNAI